MLLLHTVGTVKVGEIVRHTVTYTPSQDHILPVPSHLHLRIKNTAALPLRAAYFHGPYTVYVSVRRQEFHPYEPWHEGEGVASEEGIEAPLYDPHLKAGASFYAVLRVPEKLRQDANASLRYGNTAIEQQAPGGRIAGAKEMEQQVLDPSVQRDRGAKDRPKSVTWIVEVISQAIFSPSASVGFEVMLSRDEKSLSYGFPFGPSNYANLPGEVGNASKEHNGARGAGGESIPNNLGLGVLSESIKLKVQDTLDLWNLPSFPSWNDEEPESSFLTDKSLDKNGNCPDPDELDEQETKRRRDEESRRKERKTKRVHLVILTHGLHSNTGADMLFLKEMIDEEGGKTELYWKEQNGEKRKPPSSEKSFNAAIQEGEDEREMLIVRGFHGNVCRTERGIRYLGKRLAQYVISLVDPKEPNPHPLQKASKPQANVLHKNNVYHPHLTPAARQSFNAKQMLKSGKPAYKVTSISFIGHSLGGLVQTYAIAWIHAHHPNFFCEVKPASFITLATPFLGLSNENPVYVKFALAFGLVGRTGQDLGLAWRAPDMAASLANAFSSADNDPGKISGGKADTSKPLLRILPAGPAHEVLKMFKSRTVYANVVNDGIVPLRTSCLLFLDWKGLGRVEKVRRENAKTAAEHVAGLVGWGISQLTSGTSAAARQSIYRGGGDNRGVSAPGVDNQDRPDSSTVSIETHSSRTVGTIDNETIMGAPRTTEMTERERIEQFYQPDSSPKPPDSADKTSSASNNVFPNAISSLLTLFRPQAGNKQDKTQKMIKRSQTLRSQLSGSGNSYSAGPTSLDLSPVIPGVASPLMPLEPSPRVIPNVILSYDDFDPIFSPPRTTILETAGDLLNPPLPPVEFIVDPNSRPRTIFHDRVYHSHEIPPPSQKQYKRVLGSRKAESSENTNSVPEVFDDSSKGDTLLNVQLQSRTATGKSGNSTNAEACNGKTPLRLAPMKTEEEIARAYHEGMSWRKVLVKLEPDAHNNMVVRRMFANAYGWPVVRHIVDTHFSVEARAADSEEGGGERVGELGEIVNGPEGGVCEEKKGNITIDMSRNHQEFSQRITGKTRSANSIDDSSLWTDTAFDVTEYEDDDSGDEETYLEHSSDVESTPGWRQRVKGGAGASKDEIRSILGTSYQRTSLGIPTSEVSRIDVLGQSANCSSLLSPNYDAERAWAKKQEHKSRIHDVGIGRNSAMRQLARMNNKTCSTNGENADGGDNRTMPPRENQDTRST